MGAKGKKRAEGTGRISWQSAVENRDGWVSCKFIRHGKTRYGTFRYVCVDA